MFHKLPGINACQGLKSTVTVALLLFHFKILETVVAAIGAGIIGGPVGIGMVIAGAIVIQGTGGLQEMYDEYGNKVNQ